jgi:hypothetical protein
MPVDPLRVDAEGAPTAQAAVTPGGHLGVVGVDQWLGHRLVALEVGAGAVRMGTNLR